MAEIIKKMSEGKNSYEFVTPSGFVVTVHGDSEKDAREKYNEYMGWD